MASQSETEVLFSPVDYFLQNWVMVQVNAGETFTIQDDGNYNTIRGALLVDVFVCCWSML